LTRLISLPAASAALGAALLTGCATDPNVENLRESPSFQLGYSDGCLTSTEEDKSFSSKSSRDAYSFKNDKAYRAGWRQGYFECSSRIPDSNNGGRVLGERDDY
jgi:hypothetical protein